MNISVFDLAKDEVIDSVVALAKTDYGFALDKLFPLIDRFAEQRKIQDKKFYQRLERDILAGCLMPPLTIAFVYKEARKLTREAAEEYVNKNVDKGYVLDGIQRLNTLKRSSLDKKFDTKLPVYLNVIIAPTEDKLLYRMITLNNGQKPMTPRHQIEILTEELFEFNDVDLTIQTEKEKAKNNIAGSLSLGDISRSYLAFLTEEVNNENNKIIGEKMDQIIVGRIMDRAPDKGDIDFRTILKLISKFIMNEKTGAWFKVSNNLIGFCVGAKQSHKTLSKMNESEFSEAIFLFDSAFSAINPSKVNLGKYRRELSRYFIENIAKSADLDEIELIEKFSEITS
jgi:hypothetical protein